MKKILFLLSLIFMLVGCGSKEEDKANNVLYVYEWADYIPQQLFEKFQKETGIKVVEDIYSSNEEMFAKLKAGGKGYDLVIPSTDYAEIMMNEGMLDKIDKSKMPNFKNIDPIVLDKLHYFDKNNDYAVPYVMGATVIAVNKDQVKDYPRDYTIFGRTDLAGRMTLLDDMREVMTSALGTLGYPQNTTDEKAIAQAADLVKQWKKNIAKFDSESYGKGFANGDFWVVQGYAENIWVELDDSQRATTDFVIPEKGGTSYIDSFVLLKDSRNKEAAYKFLNFIQEPENYALICDHLGLPSINVPARELIKTKPMYTIEELKNTETLRDIKSTLDLQNKYWQQILVD
ncbi:extracellular solute-binding protein [Cetobacterium sp. SF1]|uniref:extracellular solute-binding protein n=1 Tax=unclassified Cetobacterium TaxID=2630983 RepID=UPI003CF33A9E